MRFDISYTTTYTYEDPVWDNMNALRIKPASGPHQRVENFELRIAPDAPVSERRDYFETEVLEFGIPEKHDRLRIDASCRAVTEPGGLPEASGWDRIDEPDYGAAGGEFLLQAGTVPVRGTDAGDVVDRLVEEVRRPSPLETVVRVAELIPDRFTYRPGVTFVGSTVADLIEGGEGVCQDFAHLALRLLRGHGIAARYVSGYLFAAPDDGGADSVEVQTHAWVEALLPAEAEPAWLALDPTNSVIADENHVKIGHGRFYQDVAPIRGVFRGEGEAELESRVRMTRANGAT